MHFLFSLLFCILAYPFLCQGKDSGEFPALYKGRLRSHEAYAHLWLYDHYHASALKKSDLAAFYTPSPSPLALLWSLEVLGHEPFNEAPLFWIGSAKLKDRLGLHLKKDRFTFKELRHSLNPQVRETFSSDKEIKEGFTSLLSALTGFERLKGSPDEGLYEKRWGELIDKNLPAKEISLLLEQEYPLIQRLQNAGSLFKVLPSRYRDQEWFPLKAINVKIAHPTTSTLHEVSNFTRFSDNAFSAIRRAYQALQETYQQDKLEEIGLAQLQLSKALSEAYAPLAGDIIQQAYGKQITAPSLNQLSAESFYVRYPWIPILILIYSLGTVLLLLSYKEKWSSLYSLSLGFIFLALIYHTLLLGIRCYILERPPVSNMFETVLYVPWIGACASLILPSLKKSSLTLLAACVTSIILLVILEVTDLNQNLDQVQAVLDSQFWLLIHVLLVVGSYGLFILGAVLGHFYLGLYLFNPLEKKTMSSLSSMILQTMYAGTAMLIIGTILGGVWAAQSWGRFWDWDPKESWAFISSCFYLLWIHAYRFGHISSFGLAMGAVGGLLTISFTWYGVNYILGTGLHSYGFGAGGEGYYYAFLIGESLFLIASLFIFVQRKSGLKKST